MPTRIGLIVILAIFLLVTVRIFAGGVAIADQHAAEGISQPLVLAPGPGNPRNSEGDFLCFDDGRWPAGVVLPGPKIGTRYADDDAILDRLRYRVGEERELAGIVRQVDARL